MREARAEADDDRSRLLIQRARPGRSGQDGAVAVRVLRTQADLTEDECALLARLSAFRTTITAGERIVPEGEPVAARVILSGWACRQWRLPDGRRQIFSFLLPGDIVGISPETRPLDELSIVALTRVEFMDAFMLREILAVGDVRHSGLVAALAALRRQEDRRILDQMVRLGRRSALERCAHLFLELGGRAHAAGLSAGDCIPMPLTQEMLADALGLSIVHLNRTLQQMKRDRLIELRAGWLTLSDRARLERLAECPQEPAPAPAVSGVRTIRFGTAGPECPAAANTE